MTTTPTMTSMQRVLTALGQKEPDRVPFFLLVTMHGARELGVSIAEYFAQPELVAEGQIRMRARYRHDCLYAFHYAPIEIEAWGGEVIIVDDGPVNSGEPFIRNPDDIMQLQPPDIRDCPCLQRVLRTTELLKARVGTDAPIIGVVMSPFSGPVMQMGFAPYLDVMHERRELFDRLMQVNGKFCVAWANAQLEAGATAICYFDPVSSSTIVPRETYLATGREVARRTIAQIKGPTATHFASGRCMPIVADVVQTGTAMVGVSAEEDLAGLKKACDGRLTVLGNLNGIEMRHWSPERVVGVVKNAIAAAGTGGGFVLSDNHGEIPWQVPEAVLSGISEAVHEWGRYPLDWLERSQADA